MSKIAQAAVEQTLVNGQQTSNVKPTFFKDRLLSFSHQRPPKNLNIFVFETKFIIEPKHSLSDLKFFGLYSNVLLLLKKSWNTSKSFGFVPKLLEKIETFCFCK